MGGFNKKKKQVRTLTKEEATGKSMTPEQQAHRESVQWFGALARHPELAISAMLPMLDRVEKRRKA